MLNFLFSKFVGFLATVQIVPFYTTGQDMGSRDLAVALSDLSVTAVLSPVAQKVPQQAPN